MDVAPILYNYLTIYLRTACEKDVYGNIIQKCNHVEMFKVSILYTVTKATTQTNVSLYFHVILFN